MSCVNILLLSTISVCSILFCLGCMVGRIKKKVDCCGWTSQMVSSKNSPCANRPTVPDLIIRKYAFGNLLEPWTQLWMSTEQKIGGCSVSNLDILAAVLARNSHAKVRIFFLQRLLLFPNKFLYKHGCSHPLLGDDSYIYIADVELTAQC